MNAIVICLEVTGIFSTKFFNIKIFDFSMSNVDYCQYISIV